MVVNSLRLPVILIAASIPYLASAQSAQEILLKSMVEGRRIPLTAIIQNSSGGMMSQVKLEQQKSGYTRVTVLQPLSRAGMASIDDGKKWVTYIPDRLRLVIQESPRKNMIDPKELLRIATRNYTFRFEADDEVAGQKVRTILAVPKSRDLPMRRYSVDKETCYLLRLEVIEAGVPSTVHDTKSIKYGDGRDEKPLELNPPERTRQIHLAPHIKMSSPTHAKRELGFEPVLPSKLPYGFVIHQRHIVKDEDGRFLAVRVTDGLASGTIYQWSKSDSQQPWKFDEKLGDVELRGVCFRVAGDMPARIRFKLLESFIGPMRSAPEEPHRRSRTFERTETRPTEGVPDREKDTQRPGIYTPGAPIRL
ncbi:MAG TPA: hypothetical protein VM328_02470 [Fimbriimonadaceae bacterium]|nr:hypothetical protein [Fimbriimonadaceae bacterium]